MAEEFEKFLDTLKEAEEEKPSKQEAKPSKKEEKPSKKDAKPSKKDVISRMVGVNNVNSMMVDINGNFLVKNQLGEMIERFMPTVAIDSHTPMERLGSVIYSQYGSYLAPFSLFCTLFSHLDWEEFARIAAEEDAKEEKDPEKEECPILDAI
jgi:hypothetical protein